MSLKKRILHKTSYWIGYMVAKADNNELTVNISDEDLAQEMLEQKILESVTGDSDSLTEGGSSE